MATTQSARQFLASNDAVQIREQLEEMMTSDAFNTKSMYSPLHETDQLFVDKHMKYLSLHTNINPQQYLSNLKLMTRVG